MAIGDVTTGIELTIGNGGPDPVAALLATNLQTLALESGDSVLSNDDNLDTEYYFNGVTIPIATSATLNGYFASARYYVETEKEPDANGPTYERDYPNFTVASSSFTVEVEGVPDDRPIFLTDTNAESLYTPDAGSYGELNPAVAGITNGSQYVYTRIFNESEFEYVPRLSPAIQGSVRPDNGQFPNAPEINDPANGIYPYNTITSYAPDPRRQILLTFTYTIVYSAGGGEVSDTVTIEQYISQPFQDLGPLLNSLLENSYYGKGLYGLDQWPDDEPALYEEDGDAIAPIPRVDILIPDTSTSSGFAEYDQNTFGAGFPLKLDTEPDAVPEIAPDVIDDTDFGWNIPGVDYTKNTYDNEGVDATEYLF